MRQVIAAIGALMLAGSSMPAAGATKCLPADAAGTWLYSDMFFVERRCLIRIETDGTFASQDCVYDYSEPMPVSYSGTIVLERNCVFRLNFDRTDPDASPVISSEMWLSADKTRFNGFAERPPYNEHWYWWRTQ